MPSPVSNLSQLQQEATALGMARIDAQMLLLHACGQDTDDRAWLIAHGDDQPSSAQQSAWQSFVQRRMEGEPVAYIVGHKAFYGLRLKVSPAVLDPRDDTETLVDWALELIPAGQALKLLDLGTGSGAVALSIASQRPLAHITATDASAAALKVARSNAAALQLPCSFVLSDAQAPHWFSALSGEVFDVIVSNPPYIAEGDAHLPALKHEPSLALTSGADGLDAIRSIILHASHHLHSGGWLLLEHGFDQAARVRHLLVSHGFADATTRQDLGGMDRCTGARLLSIQ